MINIIQGYWKKNFENLKKKIFLKIKKNFFWKIFEKNFLKIFEKKIFFRVFWTFFDKNLTFFAPRNAPAKPKLGYLGGRKKCQTKKKIKKPFQEGSYFIGIPKKSPKRRCIQSLFMKDEKAIRSTWDLHNVVLDVILCQVLAYTINGFASRDSDLYVVS